MKCFFCPNNLDKSDEHIILNSLNGKLHSKEIICSSCNNFFGSNLDAIAKEFFNPILMILNFKNASGIIAGNLQGEDDYLWRKDKQVIQRKPKIIEKKINGKTLVSVKGDPKNAIKLFNKRVEKLEKTGSKVLASRMEANYGNEPIRIKAEFKTNAKFDLLLNKIVTEYCAYNKLNTPEINELALKVRNLDESTENIFYCDPNRPIREFKSGEITHLIKLWSEEKTVYGYIELFNVISVIIVLGNDHNDEPINFQYYQDAVTGEKFTEIIELDKTELATVLKEKNRKTDFAEMANKLFARKRDRDFDIKFKSVLAEIKERFEKEVEEGKITDSEFNEKFINESTEYVAKFQIDNPYMWEDLDDANNDEINYIHSNLRESQFEDFCKKYNSLIGKEVRIDSKKIYIAEKFEKIPVAEQNGIQIINVQVVLYNGLEKIYIPYREFFEGIENK